jgi:putative tryptophan/tyrosine transport system substrate-binding protein
VRRREFIALIGSAAAVSLLPVPVARAQERGRIYRLGVIAGPGRQVPRIVAFFDELKELGFVEGRNLQIVAGGFGLRVDQFAEAAATVVKSSPDVVLCTQDPAVRAMQEATHTIPIVGLSVDMVAAGLVRSLARPGGNTTGVSTLAPELNGKRQEILMEAVPGARRIAVLTDSIIAPPGTSGCRPCARCRGRGLLSRHARTDRANDGQSQGMGGHRP